jgi:hypothetical protein
VTGDLEREDDFLAFWRDHRAKDAPETRRILGVDVIVPTDLPLGIEDIATELQNSQDPDDIGRLVALIFGADIYGQWKSAGVSMPMLQVLFAWGMSNGAGKAISFEEAAALVADAEAKQAAEGKAPAANRAARRASSPTPASAAAGRTSSRTSAASTGSGRKTSRT